MSRKREGKEIKKKKKKTLAVGFLGICQKFEWNSGATEFDMPKDFAMRMAKENSIAYFDGNYSNQ